MTKRIFSKTSWKDAIGATKMPKRLKLLSHIGLFICPVAYCESEPYRRKRGCRKHVFKKHGWYYYFEEKPDIAKAFSEFSTRTSNYQLSKLVKTCNMPLKTSNMFLKTCKVGVNFKKWSAPVVEEKVKVMQISYFAKSTDQLLHISCHISCSIT